MTENEALAIVSNMLYEKCKDENIEQDGSWVNYWEEMKENALQQAVDVFDEIQQYRAIGTVEECWMAKERLTPKKAIAGIIFKTIGYYQCPICKGLLMRDERFCNDCGQRIIME